MTVVLILIGILLSFLLWIGFGVTVFIANQESIEEFIDIDVDEDDLLELTIIGFVLPFILPIFMVVKGAKKLGSYFDNERH